MFVRPRTLLIVMLAPALAIAAPKPKKPPTPKKPPAPAPAPAEPEPAPDKPDAAPAPTPAPPSAAPGGGGGGGGGTSGGGAGGGSGEPKAAGEPAPPKAEGGPDVDTLRQEYLSLRDELFKSRARAATVASQLYSTRIQIRLTYTTGRYYTPAKSSIRLDGANVYEDTSGAIAGDDGIRFDGYVAPGKHLVTFHIEATGKDDDTFTSTTESQVVVKAIAGKDLIVAAKAKDSGDIAYEWKKSEHGSYGLGVDVSVKTVKNAEAKEAKK